MAAAVPVVLAGDDSGHEDGGDSVLDKQPVNPRVEL